MGKGKFSVTFGDCSFRADSFEFLHIHPGDNWGMPGKGETQISLRTWVLSDDSVNLTSSTRKKLFEHANWFRGDDKNKPQVLSLEIQRDAQEGSHTYTVENAWIKTFVEYQDMTWGPDRVAVRLEPVEPNETRTSIAEVEKGDAQPVLRIEIVFIGFIDAGTGSKIS